MLHGAGSSADFISRCFTPAALGVTQVRAIQCRRADQQLDALDRELAALAGRVGAGQDPTCTSRRLIVGGVSIGAHAAARWAARHPTPLAPRTSAPGSAEGLSGLVLVMPAWIGPAGAVAGLTGHAADQITRFGIAGSLVRIRESVSASLPADDWVLDELDRAWSGYTREELAATLAMAAATAGPTVDELARIRCPTIVIALADDPLHPLDVAERVAAAIPLARLSVLTRSEIQADRTAFARAASAGLSIGQSTF